MPPFDPVKHQNDIQTKIENSGRWNTTEANKADFELCNNLMLLDTVALTATVIIVTNKNVLHSLGDGAIIMLIITSVFVVLSIFSGIGNYIMLNLFQRKWSQINSRIVSRLVAGPLSPAQINQILIEEQANVPGSSNPVFWFGQIIFLSIALVLYLAIIIIALSSSFR